MLSPTRELSLQVCDFGLKANLFISYIYFQIYNESRKFAYRTPITSALLYGGRENYRDQINKLRVRDIFFVIFLPRSCVKLNYFSLDVIF